jgi:hypothetical protein
MTNSTAEDHTTLLRRMPLQMEIRSAARLQIDRVGRFDDAHDDLLTGRATQHDTGGMRKSQERPERAHRATVRALGWAGGQLDAEHLVQQASDESVK